MAEEKQIRVFSELQIWAHKHVIHFTAAFLLTGLVLAGGDTVKILGEIFGYPIASIFAPEYDAYSAGVQVARWIHRLSALGLAFIIVPFFIAEIFNAGRWEFWPECWSLGCFKQGVRKVVDYYLGRGHPEFGKYNLGQKCWVWLASIGMVIMYITGIILWFRESFSVTIWEYARLIHAIGFYLSIIFLAVHVYLATMIPEHRPMVTAIFRTGTASADFLRTHHPQWFEKLRKKEEM